MSSRLLIVDDEKVLCDNLKIFLSIKGYDVKCADSGSNGLKIIKTFIPDIIILDLHLSGDMSGLDFLRVAKGFLPNVKVVVLTGSSSSDKLLNEAESLGISEILFKPISAAEIKETIDKL